MTKIQGYDLTDPLVKKLNQSRRKKKLVAKVRQVNDVDKKINTLLGELF